MDDTSVILATLSMLLVPAAVCCFFGALVAIFVGVIVLFVRRGGKMFAPVPETVGPQFLAEALPTLLPWEAGQAFPDLAARWRGWWRSMSGAGKRSGGHYHGVVKSLSRPDEGWLAFTLDRTMYWNASMRLHTSANQLDMTITYQKISGFRAYGGVATLTFDGEPLGRVELPACVFYDAQGRQLGRYARDTGLKVRLQPAWGPVEMGGRVIAEINDLWLRLPITWRTPQPALRNLAASLTPEEQKWLLGLLAVELYYDSLYQRKSE